jgi:hypothetical protein
VKIAAMILQRASSRTLLELSGVAVDFVELAIEESPNNEATYASAVTPNRKSTNLLYPPSRTARIAPSPQHLSRADELRGIRGEVPRLIESFEPVGVLTTRAYGDLMTYLLALAGFDYVYTAGGALVTDPNATTVTGVNALNSAVINVADASPFEAAGTVIIGGGVGAVTYTGKTATSLTGCGAHPATVGGETVNGNVPVNANKWVFTKRGGINARTARLRTNYADENVLLEGYGFGVSSLGINAGAEVSADLMGLFMRRLAADTVTVPAVQSESVQPFRRGDLYVSALAGGGVLSDWSISIANTLERIRTASLQPPSDWPDLMELGDDQVAVTGTLPKRVLSGTDYDALMAATTFAMTAKWIGRSSIGATAKKYGCWIEMPKCQYVGGDQDELQNRRRHGFSPDWFAAWDSAAGYDAKITLVNGVNAIETFV